MEILATREEAFKELLKKYTEEGYSHRTEQMPRHSLNIIVMKADHLVTKWSF